MQHIVFVKIGWGSHRQVSTLRRVERADLHSRVDVEHALGAARRPDGALDAKHVGLEVILVDGPRELLFPRDLLDGQRSMVTWRSNPRKTCLLRAAREVVIRIHRARVALRQGSMAAVVGLDHRELPALREVELDVELAVLAVVLGLDVLPGLRDELVVDERQRRQVARQLAVDRAGRAARATVGKPFDLDVVTVGGVALGQRGGGCGCAKEKGEDVGELHLGKDTEMLDDLQRSGLIA